MSAKLLLLILSTVSPILVTLKLFTRESKLKTIIGLLNFQGSHRSLDNNQDPIGTAMIFVTRTKARWDKIQASGSFY